MTKICLSEFVSTLTPLFTDLKRDELTNIYAQSCLMCTASEEEFAYIRSKDEIVKRTVFIFPRQNLFYISFKKKDLDHINRNLASIRQNKQLRKILGTFAKIGFVRERGRTNTCTPMIRVNLYSRPAIEIKAKVTRLVHRENILYPSQELVRQIDNEMKYREDYNDDPNVPKLEYHGYYMGAHADETWLKHLEISELLRDLHRMIHTELVRFSQPQKFQILYQIVNILNTLHADGIIHGDVKPENIYLRSEEEKNYLAKLGDFGHLAELHKLHETNGTEIYWSPEHILYAFTQHPNDRSAVSFPADIWCVGWIVVHLFNLKVPLWYHRQLDFIESPSESTYLEYQKALREFDALPYPSSGTIQEQILWYCWRANPNERIQTDGLLEIL